MSMGTVNPLAMSDEDFLKMNGPDEIPADEDTSSAEEEEEQAEDDDGGAAEGESDDGSSGSDGEEEDDTSGSDDDGNDADGDDDAGDADADAGTEDTDTKDSKKPVTKDDGEANKTEEKSDSAVDYKAMYEQVMAPFQANGKTFTPKSVAEVIQLAQMGANYTKKMQDIQPHRKVLLMLQNNDLLDEGKLSYLIDLDKKNPEAIKKLIKDAGIDPLDIDTTSEADYTAGNHQVTDEDARFHEVLTDIASSDPGKQTLATINNTWDQASKEVIWAQPEIMSVIHEQRTNGVYDLIVAEMDRQKVLGKIPANTPFLQAYKSVGDALASAGAFGSVTQPSGTPAKPEPQKIGERAAVPKPKAANGDKAKAASTTRSSSSRSGQIVNPLAMSDEEFLKLDALRNRL